MRYEIKGSNTLYMVWGIITYVFAGLYGIAWLIAIVLMGMGSSILGQAGSLDAELGIAHGYFIILILVIALVVIIGLIIRIMAGVYLVRPYVRSKGALIAVAVMYFLIAVLDLVSAIINGKVGSIGTMLIALFWMLWAVATGVFLILKQARTVEGGMGTAYGGQEYYHEMEYPQMARAQPDRFPTEPYGAPGAEAGYELKACIEGLFGDYIGRRYILRVGENCRIGRDPGCEIQLSHSKVSRIHCAVKLLPDGRFEVTDRSSNGTYYENNALPNGEATVVDAGGMLVVGCPDNVFSLNIC